MKPLLRKKLSGIQKKPHSDYAISKYGAEMEIWSARRVRCNNCKSRNYYWSGFQEQGQLLGVANGLRYYTLGKGAFVAVVVRMSVELMKSSTRNRRFVLVAQTIRYRDVLNTIADALKVKDLTVILNRS
jgi:hypothetical protein